MDCYSLMSVSYLNAFHRFIKYIEENNDELVKITNDYKIHDMK
jgi:hypothetical protein